MVNPSADHLAPQGGGFEPQRAFNWTAIIPGLGDTELIRLAIVEMALPQYSTAEIHMRFLNEDVKVSGGASVGNNYVRVRDFVDKPTYRLMDAWMNQVHDPKTGRIGFASEYKKQMSLMLLDPHGDPVRSIDCRGVWPSRIEGTPLRYESDTEVVVLSLTLCIDKYFTKL